MITTWHDMQTELEALKARVAILEEVIERDLSQALVSDKPSASDNTAPEGTVQTA